MKIKTNIYRVFIERNYIAVEFFDIKAKNKPSARRIAEKAGYKIYPDVRQEATDNGWISTEPVNIPKLGYSSSPFKVKKVYEDKKGNKVYQETKINT